MALNDLFERVIAACGSPGSPAENHERTVGSLAIAGGSPGSLGSPGKMTCTEKLRQEADEKREFERTDVVEPFDREAFEERAGICEFDGGLTREEAKAIAWNEDDRRRGESINQT